MSTIHDAHVICCNDNPEYVILGNLHRAREKMEHLADQHYHKTGGVEYWKYEARHSGRESPYHAYRALHYWHVRSVPGEESHEHRKSHMESTAGP